jgi:MFS family permease
MSSRIVNLAHERTRQQFRRAVVASTIGSVIEWYDFSLYATVAGLYLGKLFFPSSNPLLSTLVAFSTYFVGFAARPLGGVIFGHQGDRIGRKATLITTLSLMGIATFLIGLVPTYAQIGVLGGITLVILRILQGLAAGGEWGAAVLMATEWSGPRRRGFAGACAQLGIPGGSLLGYILLQVSTLTLGPNSYWGWRIPFLVSIALVAIGLYVRLGVLETPIFARLLEERAIERTPVFAVLRRNFKEVVLALLFKTGQQGPSLLIITFVLTYLTLVQKVPKNTALLYVMISTTISLFTTVYFGHLSDQVGRRRLLMIAFAALLVFGVPYYLLLGTGIGIVVLAAIILSNLINDCINGPQPAFLAEAFPANRRYSGISLGFQFAALTSGGPAPLLATWLIGTFHSAIPIGFYIAASAALGLVATALLPERSASDLAGGAEDVPVRKAV